MQVALERTIETIQTNQNFVVTTHINPDGDGIGSELGLARFLRDQSKKATVINATPTPRNYQFLDRFKEIHLYEPLSLNVELATAEVIFILDISKWERLGPMSEVIRNHPGLKICIDHHPLCGNFADINLVCQDACASGELVLQVIHTMGGSMTRDGEQRS